MRMGRSIDASRWTDPSVIVRLKTDPVDAVGNKFELSVVCNFIVFSPATQDLYARFLRRVSSQGFINESSLSIRLSVIVGMHRK